MTVMSERIDMMGLRKCGHSQRRFGVIHGVRANPEFRSVSANLVKTCPACKLTQPGSAFAVNRSKHDGLSSYCKRCKNQQERERQARNIAAGIKRKRGSSEGNVPRYRRHGLTASVYESLLRKQNFRCAICGSQSPGSKGKTWAIDHDHSHCPGPTGCAVCVRGLLCHLCNAGIGHLRDNTTLLRRAISYIETWTKQKYRHESLF